MKPGVKVTVDRLPQLVRSLKKLTADRVLVGVPASTADRQPEPDEPAPPSNALIGYLMETGDPERNLPARPFLGPGVQNAKDDIVKRMEGAGRAALDGKPDVMERNLAAAGQTAASSVQRKITDGPFAPLAESTLAQRRARGRTGEKPLIDTGQLRRAITFVVERKA